jgi:hypothetical protein
LTTYINCESAPIHPVLAIKAVINKSQPVAEKNRVVAVCIVVVRFVVEISRKSKWISTQASAR